MSDDALPLAVLESLYQRGKYVELIGQLEKISSRTVREEALYGIALMREMQTVQAEAALLLAASLGDQEAQVELGNYYRATGQQFHRAITHFEQILPELTGELRYRALRWYGVTLVESGRLEGQIHVDEARLGYLSLGLHVMAARTGHTLSVIYNAAGKYASAKTLLEEVMPVLETDENSRSWANANLTYFEVLIDEGEFDQAAVAIATFRSDLARRMNGPASDLFDVKIRARILSLQICKEGLKEEFLPELEDFRDHALKYNDASLSIWSSCMISVLAARNGQHAAALKELAQLREVYREDTLETRLTRAYLALRRSDNRNALRALRELSTPNIRRNRSIYVCATLLHAVAEYQAGRLDEALESLDELLTEVAAWSPARVQSILRIYLPDAEQLLGHAWNLPSHHPLLTAVFGESSAAARLPLLQLNTLGDQPSALLSGERIDLKLSHALAVLTYLAFHPGSTREQVVADLWADGDSLRGADRFRQCLAQLRKAIGPDIIERSGPHQEPTYAISEEYTVILDAEKLLEDISAGRTYKALSAYKGVFLKRLPSTLWIAQRRDELMFGVTGLLRRELERAARENNHQEVIKLCGLILSVDPEDIEIEEWRLKWAQEGQSFDLARYEAAWRGRLN